jgi:hypothetical protein
LDASRLVEDVLGHDRSLLDVGALIAGVKLPFRNDGLVVPDPRDLQPIGVGVGLDDQPHDFGFEFAHCPILVSTRSRASE